MRGYVERLEKEHFRHGDNCGCEIDRAGRRSKTRCLGCGKNHAGADDFCAACWEDILEAKADREHYLATNEIDN